MKAPSKEELEKLRNEMTRQEIAEHFGVTMAVVKNWVTDMNLDRKVVRKKSNKKIKAKECIEPSIDSGLPLMEKAKRRLGARLTENKAGYWLDGRPARSDKIIEEAGLKR